MRNYIRLLAALFLLWALAAFGYEISLMVKVGGYRVLSLAELWSVVHRPSIDLVRNSLDNGTWNVLLETYLGWPGWAALALPGAIQMILGLGRRLDETVVLRELPGR